MSDGMEFTMPEPVANPLTDADLQRLSAEAVTYWAKSGNWTIEQACALLRGFVPLEEWEPDYPIRKMLLQIHTAPLQAEITRQSTEPLPASLPPRQWLEKAEKCGQVFAPIRAALSKGKAATPQPKTKTKEAIQAHVNERRDDIAQRQWRNYQTGARPTKPTKGTVANELLAEINKEFGKAYKDEESILRMYLDGWDLPSPE